MVSFDGGARQNVCRFGKGHNDWHRFPTDDTAEFICKKLGFHGLETVTTVGPSEFPFSSHYSSLYVY